MIVDSLLTFATAQSVPDGTAVASTNVFNAGSAVKLFAGAQKAVLAVAVSAIASTGSDYTFSMSFVGSAAAALNSANEILAGIPPTAAGTPVAPALYTLGIGPQKVAKQYYGVLWDLGGTSPTATVKAHIAEFNANNLIP